MNVSLFWRDIILLKSLFKSMGLREEVSSSLKDMFCAYLFFIDLIVK